MPKKKQVAEREHHSNKVFQALQELTVSEHKRFLKFLQSPYFNQSKTLILLYENLLRYIEAQKNGFHREEIWKRIFAHQKYDDVNFRKYCSDLLKLLETYLAHEQSARDDINQAINLLDFVARRKIEPLQNSALRNARAEISKTSYRAVSYYYNAYLLERKYYSMLNFDVRLNVRANYEEMSDNLDLFYWIEKIKLYSSVLSQKKTGNFEYRLNFADEIIEYLSKYPIEDVPELAIHYYAFLTLKDEDNVEHYYNLRRFLNQYAASMPQEEAIQFFDSALHYCTGKVNKGSRDFFQEYFDLFEMALVNGIFIINGELATWRFNNAVAAALRLGKVEWAEKFVKEYHDKLPLENRDNTYSFNLARVYFYQKRFNDILSISRSIEYEDIGYNLISKAMLVLVYYELDEIDALESFVDSFRVFLNRHKDIPAQRRKSYLNLIKYVRRLTRLLPGEKAAIEKLRQEIIREKATTVNHEWLLEKLAELE